MDYNMNNLVPYIPASEYDTVAEEFLNEFYADALKQPMAVPIERIAKDMGLDVQYLRKAIYMEQLFLRMGH